MNVVITGATKGIGRAIAFKFAEHGANLAICSRKDEDLENMTHALRDSDSTIEVISKETDVANKEETEEFGKFIMDKWGKVDVLINNAGLFIPGMIHEEEEGVMEKMIQTNLFSAYYLTRKLLPAMIDNRSGHIFNMCSTASIIPYINGGSYCISKFALLGFSKVLRQELKRYDIKVTSILPGATFTASWEGTDLPEERFMTPEDVAETVYSAYALSERANVEEIIMRPFLGDV